MIYKKSGVKKGKKKDETCQKKNENKEWVFGLVIQYTEVSLTCIQRAMKVLIILIKVYKTASIFDYIICWVFYNNNTLNESAQQNLIRSDTFNIYRGIYDITRHNE